MLLLWYECVILLGWFCGTRMSPIAVKILTVKAEADEDFNLRVLSMGKVIDIKQTQRLQRSFRTERGVRRADVISEKPGSDWP